MEGCLWCEILLFAFGLIFNHSRFRRFLRVKRLGLFDSWILLALACLWKFSILVASTCFWFCRLFGLSNVFDNILLHNCICNQQLRCFLGAKFRYLLLYIRCCVCGFSTLTQARLVLRADTFLLWKNTKCCMFLVKQRNQSLIFPTFFHLPFKCGFVLHSYNISFYRHMLYCVLTHKIYKYCCLIS